MLPDDESIPALVAMRQHGPERVLIACDIDEPLIRLRVLRYHAGKRCTVEVQTDRRRFILKAFRRPQPQQVAILESLVQSSGMRPRGPGTPILLGHSSTYACLAIAWMEGVYATDLLAQGLGARVGDLAAAWLSLAARFDVGPLASPLANYEAPHMLEALGRWIDRVAATDSTLGHRASACVEHLSQSSPKSGPVGLLHMNLSVHHVIDLGEGPGILDWDAPSLGPLELDAGAFLVSLALQAEGASECATQVGHAERSFRAGIERFVDPTALEWFRRAALVKHVKHACVRQRPGWREQAGRLLDEAGTPPRVVVRR